MMEEFKSFYARFNYNEDTGFICSVPTGKAKEHLSIGFDNIRKEFNVHFTDDSIVVPGAKRRNFIFVISAFRFFLFLKRFEMFYPQSFLNLVLDSKTNLGKLKKNGFLMCNIEDTEESRNQLLKITKNGKKWKFNPDLDLAFIIDSFEPVENFIDSKNSFVPVYKWKNEHLSMEGFLMKFDTMKGLFFIPLKKYNRYSKHIAISMYNYFNKYPLKSTLEFRKMMFEKLKHPYLNQ